MNIAITNFVAYLNNTLKRATEGTPDYSNEMPSSSPPITYRTYENTYGGSETYARGENDGEKLSIANELVSQENRKLRAEQVLSGFEDQLNILFTYLKNNELSFKEKQYLLISLDDYFKAISVPFYDMFSFKTYIYTVTHYDPNDDMDYIGWPVKYYVRCPTGRVGVHLELNALKNVALEKIFRFNSQQIERQLPASIHPTTFINENHRAFIEDLEEKHIPTAMQESLFDFLTNIMLIDSHKRLKEYKGLARLKSDSLFIDSMNSNVNAWIKTIESPKQLQYTIVSRAAATPRKPSIFTLFGGTHAQNIFKKMVSSEVTRRKETPVITASAPIEINSNVTLSAWK